MGAIVSLKGVVTFNIKTHLFSLFPLLRGIFVVYRY